MSKLILLIVGAAWLAVLLPPLIRARLNSSPLTSVNQFQKKNSSLRNLGSANSHMRGMSRELTPNRQNRPGSGYPQSRQGMQSPRRSGGANHFSNLTGPILRPQGTKSHQTQNGDYYVRQMKLQRQRQNVIGLASSTAISLFLALSTGVMAFVWAFTLSLIGLCFYCYILVENRKSRENKILAARFRHRNY